MNLASFILFILYLVLFSTGGSRTDSFIILNFIFRFRNKKNSNQKNDDERQKDATREKGHLYFVFNFQYAARSISIIIFLCFNTHQPQTTRTNIPNSKKCFAIITKNLCLPFGYLFFLFFTFHGWAAESSTFLLI